MEDAESPLDVLSRAATMVQQENQQSESSTSSNEDDTSKTARGAHPPPNKQTTKWKRDRRRLPEYSRKSDPKAAEAFGGEPGSPEAAGHADTPLDMSVRHRGLPPSYAQTMSNPGYRTGFRPSVIQNGVPPPAGRDQLPSGISMCDPIIDEHFRRSLGDDYHVLFKTNQSKDKETQKPPPKVTSIVTELMDSSGLSVDDHFAKALGDTWAKLKKDEMKTSENNLVSISN